MLPRGRLDVEEVAPFLADVSQGQTVRIYEMERLARRAQQIVDALLSVAANGFGLEVSSCG